MDQVIGLPQEAGRSAPAQLHQAVAWCNVNYHEDSNSIHTHDQKRWSAVYFVSEGEPNAPGFPSPLGGQLVFRCGPRSDVSSAGGASDANQRASHTYFAVHPVPGSLWMFPGSIPHLVLGSIVPAGGAKARSPRVSIAVNFVDAAPKPPTDHGAGARAGETAPANFGFADLILSCDDLVGTALPGQTHSAAMAVRAGRTLISEVLPTLPAQTSPLVDQERRTLM